MPEKYIIVYEWLLRHPELTAVEALIVSHIVRWGKSGCFQSNASLGRLFKKHPRQIQRMIKDLVRRGWLAPLYHTKQKRVLYASLKKPPLGPLFDYQKKATEEMNRKRALTAKKLIRQTVEELQ